MESQPQAWKAWLTVSVSKPKASGTALYEVVPPAGRFPLPLLCAGSLAAQTRAVVRIPVEQQGL